MMKITFEDFIKTLTVPIAVFDLETTHKEVTKARIVSIAIKKILPDGTEENKYMLIDPEMHIPAEATEVHNITDEMIKANRGGQGAAKFSQVAAAISAYLKGAILAGYNSDRFDIVVLSEEFSRCGIQFPEEGFKSLDCMTIFYEKEKRDLAAAKMFYNWQPFEDAHNAAADVQATFEVLLGQIDMYPDLQGMNIEQLAEFTRKKDRVDLGGRLKRTEENIIVFAFGKHIDQPVASVFKTDTSYYTWLMSEKYEAPSDTKRWLKKIYDYIHQNK